MERKRPLLFASLVLGLAIAIHVDWHLARPAHHRLSLGWSEHWLVSAAAFATVGWLIVRFWPKATLRTSALIVLLAVLVAQVIEPILEVATYQHRIGYPNEPERMRVFFIALATGLPAMALALWLCRRHPETAGLPRSAP